MNNTECNSMSIVENNEPERLILYRSSVHNTLQNITSEVTLEEFTKLFQELPSFKNKHKVVSNFYDILTKYVYDTVYDKVDEHITEEKLSEKFSQLEEQIQKNSDCITAEKWRPSRNIQKNLRSYTMQEKIKFKEKLKNIIASKEAAIVRLKFDVENYRRRAKEVEKQMGETLRTLDLIQESNTQIRNECQSIKELTQHLIEK